MCTNQSTASKSSDKIKATIKDNPSKEELAKLAEENILKSIDERFSQATFTPVKVLGLLVIPFSGSIEHLQTISLQDHIKDVTDLLIWLSHMDNLKKLPEHLQYGVTTTLSNYHHVLKGIEYLSDACYIAADLHHISHWKELSPQEFKEILEMYVSPELIKHL